MPRAYKAYCFSVVSEGYVHDPALEEATARYVAGDITREEYRQLMIEPLVR